MHILENVPQGNFTPLLPNFVQIHSCISLLNGKKCNFGYYWACGHAHPADLSENVPGGKFYTPTQFRPNPPMYLAAAWQKV